MGLFFFTSYDTLKVLFEIGFSKEIFSNRIYIVCCWVNISKEIETWRKLQAIELSVKNNVKRKGCH